MFIHNHTEKKEILLADVNCIANKLAGAKLRTFLDIKSKYFYSATCCMVRHGTVRYGSLLGGFLLGTVPGTWYFFSTTSAEVPSVPYRYQNVTCRVTFLRAGENRHYCVTELATRDPPLHLHLCI